MNDLTPFRRATPAMIVGRAFDGGPAPLGLSEPFALNGGDRLGPDGIAFDLLHEHQPAFVRWVTSNCQALIAAERPWFRARPLLVTGAQGGGRTHAGWRLAKAADVTSVVLDLTNPLIAASVASSGRVNETLWASPITIAMAAKRCANPVVSVIGIDVVAGDVAAGLVAMIDPATGRAWSEDRLETYMDFGEVTWILQCDDLNRVPEALRQQAAHVRFDAFPSGIETTAALSILLEVIENLGLDEADPALDWPNVVRHLGGYHRSAKDVYARMVQAVIAAASWPNADRQITDDDHTDHVPF